MKKLTEEDIVSRWKQTGLIEGIQTEENQKSMAFIFQAQIMYNEGSSDSAIFKRLSIPMCRRVFAGLTEHKKVYPIFDGEGNWLTLKIDTNIFEAWNDSHIQYRMEHEAEQCALSCMTITEQLAKLPGNEIGFGGFRYALGTAQAYVKL